MSEAKEKIQNFIENLTQFTTLHEPQTYKNLTIIPLILKDDVLDFITIKEAETSNVGFIQELEGGEQVATLQAVNQGTKSILIPYMQVVQGGKQDRTIYEPILVAAGSTISIPSKCIERSRWTYGGAAQRRGDKKFRSSAQKMSYSIHANAIRAPYKQKSAQSEVWNSIEAMSSKMNLCMDAAPTRSGIQMQNTQKGRVEDYTKHFKIVENQAGMIGLVNNQVVAIELYGNPTAFKALWEDLLNSFAMEALLRADEAKDTKPLKPAEIHERALTCFENCTMQIKERPGIGLGTVIEFADPNLIWAGTALIHENKFAHLYIVGKSIFPEEHARIRQMQATRLQRQMDPLQQRQIQIE